MTVYRAQSTVRPKGRLSPTNGRLQLTIGY